MLMNLLARTSLQRVTPAMRQAVPAAQSLMLANSSTFTARPLAMQGHSVRPFSTDDSHDDFQAKNKMEGASSTEMTEHISTWIKENDVCVFMKGTRKMPQCGFSRYVAVLLNAYGVKQYKDVNVLADETLRATIKEYSNWPTIPQVYIKGEFVGGCDIMKEMHEDGSLRELLIHKNIIKE